MTGGVFLTLVLVSMAWLLCFFAIYLRIGPLAGLAGSLAAFFTLALLARYGIEVPWPWVWILLPLVLLIQKR